MTTIAGAVLGTLVMFGPPAAWTAYRYSRSAQ